MKAVITQSFRSENEYMLHRYNWIFKIFGATYFTYLSHCDKDESSIEKMIASVKFQRKSQKEIIRIVEL